MDHADEPIILFVDAADFASRMEGRGARIETRMDLWTGKDMHMEVSKDNKVMDVAVHLGVINGVEAVILLDHPASFAPSHIRATSRHPPAYPRGCESAREVCEPHTAPPMSVAHVCNGTPSHGSG